MVPLGVTHIHGAGIGDVLLCLRNLKPIYTTGVNDSRNQTKRKETKNMKSGTSPIVSLTGVR